MFLRYIMTMIFKKKKIQINKNSLIKKYENMIFNLGFMSDEVFKTSPNGTDYSSV